MSFSILPNEIVLFIANDLHTADLNSLLQTNHGLEYLLTPLLYNRTLLPWNSVLLYSRRSHSPQKCLWYCKIRPHLHTGLQKVLCWASERGYERPINHLMDRGAKPDSDCYRFSETPLHLASQFGYMGVVKLLLRRSPEACTELLKRSGSEPSPLDLAAENGHQDLVAHLLPHSASTHPLSALKRAISSGHKGVVELLLQYVDSTQLHEPLRVATIHGNTDMAQLILSHVETNHLPAVSTSAFEDAVKNGHEDILGLLIAAGCNLNAKVEPSSGQTILHWLSEFTCLMLFAKNKQTDGIASVLLANGVDAAAVDLHGRTPLHLAARHSPHITYRILLLSSPLSVEEIDKRFTIVQYVHQNLLRLLAKAGADINARDRNGRTPLHEAAENSDVLTVTLLLDLGAETVFVDRRGNTALELALGFIERDGAAAVVCAIRDHELMMATAQAEVLSHEYDFVI